MKIGICRPSPLHIVTNTYEEKDINVNFVKGIITMFDDEEIVICSPMKNEDEKIINNQKLSIKFPYLKTITYDPFIEDISNIDVLFIFSKDEYLKTYKMQDGTSYDQHIYNLLDGYEGLVFYIQYNDVNFEFPCDFKYENCNFTVLMNTPKPASIIYEKKFYDNKDVQGYCLDLSELVFNSRISNVTNFYHKISLINDEKKEDYSHLKNKYHHLYSLNVFADGEDNDYIKNNYWKEYGDFIYKLQHSTIVLVDNVDTNFYNPYFFITANYTLPILMNNEIDFQVNLEDVFYYKEENMLEYLVDKSKSKHMKALRIILKNYLKDYDLKSKIKDIIAREK